MDANELEEILEGLIETPVKEFKGDCPWSEDVYIKDILAMANEPNGGRIIAGVIEEEGGSFIRVGVSGANKASYVPDLMKDRVGLYADPYVQFNVYCQADNEGKEYIVIEVLPFVEDPVICKRDGRDVYQGRIYHRSKGRRPESAAVSTSTAMRDILRLSIARKTKAYRELGLTVPESHTTQARLDEELDGL